MPRPKLRTPHLRSFVIEAALHTLSTDGATGFTTKRVAEASATSVPAVYELFGDKAGLVRELFFRGFELIDAQFNELAETDDPLVNIAAMFDVFRDFVRQQPQLFELMFSKPFAEFNPGKNEIARGASCHQHIVNGVKFAIEGGAIEGDPIDISHGLLALAQGLGLQETRGTLGRSIEARNRRWQTAIDAQLRGYRAR